MADPNPLHANVSHSDLEIFVYKPQIDQVMPLKAGVPLIMECRVCHISYT